MTHIQRWVIKIGSSLITETGRGLHLDRIHGWAKQIGQLKQSGSSVVLVSSGAVAEGVRRLGLDVLPVQRHEIQAAAAVGQMGLVHAYETALGKHHLRAAQVLLTHDDLVDRKRYLNARNTLNALLELDMIPVVNENDTVATEEIQFGDNDRIAGMVSNLIDADLMLILTNQDGLYDQDPEQFSGANLIKEAFADDASLLRYAGTGTSSLGRGGMKTKLAAAAQAALSGTTSIIANGMIDGIIQRIAQKEKHGTLLKAAYRPAAARKQWLCNLSTAASLILDAGACQALIQGRSLLPVGVIESEGVFERGDVVACCNEAYEKIAQGLVNYSSAEAQQIKGRRSAEVKAMLGTGYEEEMIHRNNLALLA